LVFQQPGQGGRDSSVTSGLNTDTNLRYEEIGTNQAQWGSTQWRWRQFQQQNHLDNEFGIEPSVMSWQDFDWDAWYSEDDGVLSGSYQPVIDVLVNRISGVNIFYNAVVTAVTTTSPASVTYKVNGGSPTVLGVDYIINTVPVTSIQRGDIAYTPALSSAYLGAAGRIVMGDLEKVLLVFDRPFWRSGHNAVPIDVGWGNWISTNVGEYPNINFMDTWSGKNALMFWAGSNWSRADTLNTDAFVQTRLLQICQIIWPNATINLQSMLRTNWSNDQFSHGSYSYWGLGFSLSTDYTTVLGPTNRVYWAGEHTRKDFIQTVHGAIFSGVDAANKVCKAVGGCSSYTRHPDTIYP